jgi:hypothetical protein
MSSDPESRSHASRWRAPVTGAVAGLAVAAAIVGPSALASNGQSAGKCAAAKRARAVVAPSAAAEAGSSPFVAAVAQLERDRTINASQAQVLDTDIQSGSIDPKQLVADGVVTAAQMKAVNDRLVAVKMGLASQAHAGSSASQSKAGG